jgi:hypothetical protein
LLSIEDFKAESLGIVVYCRQQHSIHSSKTPIPFPRSTRQKAIAKKKTMMRILSSISSCLDQANLTLIEGASFDDEVDGILEIGGPVEAKKEVKFSLWQWIKSHKLQVAGLTCIILGIICVVLSLLYAEIFTFNPAARGIDGPSWSEAAPTEPPVDVQSTRPPGKGASTAAPSSTPVRYTDAPSQAPTIPVPSQAPTIPASSQAPTIPVPTTLAPVSLSLLDQLSEVSLRNALLDPSTPQGMAFRWVLGIDERERYHHSHSTVLQRFVLSALYFATGGRRTTASWEACSAVPDHMDVISVIQVRCIFDEGTTVCAKRDAFENCAGETSLNQSATAKRWLSSVSECEWYGVSCNPSGRIDKISLPHNSLQGTLIRELGALTDMETLNLAGNQLDGLLPELQFGNLRHLNLYNNSLSGYIPNSWYEWIDLRTLDLTNNNLTGSVNLGVTTWSRLQTLLVGENQLVWRDAEDYRWMLQLVSRGTFISVFLNGPSVLSASQ